MRENKIKQILIVGLNGIGAHFCHKLHNGIKKDWSGLENLNVDVMDKDIIEQKNFGYTC